MPNNSTARREKGKKKRRGETSPSSPQQVAAGSVESFLSRSAADSGFQGDDDEVTWESATGEAALDNSLSSFHRVTSSAEPMETRKERRARERKRLEKRSLMKSLTSASLMMIVKRRHQHPGKPLFLPLSSWRARP
jgi:hypothetical protein